MKNQIRKSVQLLEKPRKNYTVIVLLTLVAFVIFSLGGYYLSKQFSGYETGKEKNLGSPAQATPGTNLTNNGEITYS